MKIKFLGAAGTVTGSSYVLTSDSGESILIDLGMFQGTADVDSLNYEPFDYDCSQLTGAILTHAHLDHCGRLPLLLQGGFRGNIWMTPATSDLTEISLLDSAKIAKQEGVEKLFDTVGAIKTINRFRTIEYHQPLKVGNFTVTFIDAGHILGSASLIIEDNNPKTKFKRIIFSGDLGNTPEDLVNETESPENGDIVIMESTYGDELHPDSDPIETIKEEINHIEASGGALLIPAFSLERTQELLHIIMHLKNEKKVGSDTPVFLDSPMAQKATQVYLNYPQLFNSHVQGDFKSGRLFKFSGLNIVADREESQDIHLRIGPKVIIAGSGMMTGGRIIGHAAHYLTIKSTRILIVGYQGEETLGREILEGSRDVVIDGENIKIAANVNSTRAMSSHADQKQLMSWLNSIKGVKKLILTHGEDEPRKVLKEKISKEMNIEDISLPVLNQELVL